MYVCVSTCVCAGVLCGADDREWARKRALCLRYWASWEVWVRCTCTCMCAVNIMCSYMYVCVEVVCG